MRLNIHTIISFVGRICKRSCLESKYKLAKGIAKIILLKLRESISVSWYQRDDLCIVRVFCVDQNTIVIRNIPKELTRVL